jgi:hypothetical protein
MGRHQPDTRNVGFRTFNADLTNARRRGDRISLQRRCGAGSSDWHTIELALAPSRDYQRRLPHSSGDTLHLPRLENL